MEHDVPSESSSVPSARVKPLDWAQNAGKAGPVARAIEDFVLCRRQRRRRSIAAAAGLMVMLVGAFAWQQGKFSSSAVSAVAARTTIISSPARQTLPDGSVVELKPGAEIDVAFEAASTAARRVVLKKGEAHFTVKPDAQRPFIVSAGGIEVRAVGTAFSVEWGARNVEVLVTEGRVAVDQPAASMPAPIPLAHVDAGSRAIVALDTAVKAARVETVTAMELSARLAWRVPRLEFNATPLGEVIELFNRHAGPQSGGAATRLILGDEELRALPLSGLLRADNVPVLLQIMESSYGIRAEPGSNGEIVLRKGR